jgi:hypothetical protein
MEKVLKKRKANEIVARGKLGVMSGTIIASSSSTSSAPSKPTIRDTRAVAARGRMALNRGRGRARGRGLRGGRSTCS